jgi:hypothetical protein
MVALIAFLELEVTLSAIAIGVSFRRRSRVTTFALTALAASVTALGLVLAWIVWFVAPACIADANLIGCTAGRAGAQGLIYAPELALLEWAWMLGVSLIARYVAGRDLAHISG